jgi:hypothetical protein
MPPLLISDRAENSYPVGWLSNNTTYYWKVIAKDTHHHATQGSLWHFTTGNGELSLVGQCATPGTSARRIWAVGAYAYVADFLNLTIIDASNPASPTIASSIDGQDLAYYIDVCVADNRVYAATWTPWYNHNDDGGYTSYNIGNPRNPTYVASAGASSTGNGISVNGNYIYVATHDSGLAVFSVADPWIRLAKYYRGFGYKDIATSGNYQFLRYFPNRRGQFRLCQRAICLRNRVVSRPAYY